MLINLYRVWCILCSVRWIWTHDFSISSVKFNFLAYKYFSDVLRSRGNIVFPNRHMSIRRESSFASPSHPALRWADTFTPFLTFSTVSLQKHNTEQSEWNKQLQTHSTVSLCLLLLWFQLWAHRCCWHVLLGGSRWEETLITWKENEALLPPVGTKRYCNNTVIIVYMQLKPTAATTLILKYKDVK